MFEVVVRRNDGNTETWDCLNELQAECVFFRARMIPETDYVEINELIDL
jgi:hypothetical protein